MYLLVLKWFLVCIVTYIMIYSLRMWNLLLHVLSLALLLFAYHLLIVLQELVCLIFGNCNLSWAITLIIASWLPSALSSVFIIVCLSTIYHRASHAVWELLWLRHVWNIGVACAVACLLSSATSWPIHPLHLRVYVIHYRHHILSLWFWWIHITFGRLKLLLLLHHNIVELLILLALHVLCWVMG